MKRLVLGLLLLALAPFVVFSIPSSPGGIIFDVVGCTGVYRIDGTTFQVDCANDEVDVSTMNATAIRVGGVTISSTSIQVGGVTISQTSMFDSPIVVGNYTLYGSTDNASLQTLGCVGGTGRCGIVSTDEGDQYISTGTALGAWRNSRTGKGP